MRTPALPRLTRSLPLLLLTLPGAGCPAPSGTDSSPLNDTAVPDTAGADTGESDSVAAETGEPDTGTGPT